jgi:VanZ family protein
MTEEHIEAVHFLFRKCAHLTEYAVLSLLLWRALRKPVRNDLRPWRWNEAFTAIFIVFLYAATDEFHQIYVPTRTPHFTDVLIDTFGATCAMIALWTLGQTLNWWPKTQPQKIQEAI